MICNNMQSVLFVCDNLLIIIVFGGMILIVTNVLQIFMHKSAMHMQTRDAMVAHRSEVKPHQCQQCLKSFSSNHQLVQHIRVHTGEKPYKCSYCDRRFKQLSHVQQHTRLHTGKCHNYYYYYYYYYYYIG